MDLVKHVKIFADGADMEGNRDSADQVIALIALLSNLR